MHTFPCSEVDNGENMSTQCCSFCELCLRCLVLDGLYCLTGDMTGGFSLLGLPLVRALGASNEDDCLNSWILANLGDSKQRLKIVQLLMDRAKAFMYKDTEILVRLGNQFSENVE